MGQTIAGVGVNALLAAIGYVAGTAGTNEVVKQTAEVNSGIYTLATLAPFVFYLVMALLMHFGYNLGKKETIALKEELETRNAARNNAA